MFEAHTFAKTMKRCRVARGLTQAEVAERLLVTPQSVSRWECGEAIPDIQHLAELSELLGVSLDMLVLNRSPETEGIIGVDAGGSKTEFVLIDTDGNLLSRVVLEGANPNACGIEKTIQLALRGIRLLCPDNLRVLGIWFGGAGLASGNHADMLLSALRKAFPFTQVFCGSDMLNVLACASTPEHCIAAISGTGSVVYLHDHGKVLRRGGNGYRFERYGSGYDVGRDAITAALRDRDGLGEKTLLTALVEQKLGGRAWEHIQELYQGDVAYIASFAPLVSEAADRNDAVALDILQQNGAHLAKLIGALVQQSPGVKTVVLSGSMLTRNKRFREMVVSQLPPGLKIEIPTYPPVFGACLHCARLLGLREMPKAENFLKKKT